ncbi:MAG: tRNA lysidine(34) synthetase TilS, partial [Lachnospiraceae bacterium]|nr:tRNA lysidine(34) synthetase TilS [Lachnospiraceae bacterium]
MIDKVLAYIEKWQMIAKQDKIVIGISGGADSVCLLLVLLELRKALEFSIVAVHVNHKLRGVAAEADEKYVEKLCAHNDVLLERYHYDVNLIAKDKKVSTEEAGRIVRREAFNKAKEKYQGTKIAMAHHKNDNVETLLMNLARGTSLKGLGGILPVRGDIIRPLLCVERKEIELFLKNKGIDYCTDKSNEQDDYTRNRVRNHILPYFENEINVQTVTHMNNTIEQMQELQRYM